MKKSIENYNNIRISKRIKSANDDPHSLLTTTITTTTESSTTITSSTDTTSSTSSSSLSSKKFIFKSKATNKTTTMTTTTNSIKTPTTNITNINKTETNPKFKLKRSFDDENDDDDDDDDIFKTSNQSGVRKSPSKSPNKSPNKTLNNYSSSNSNTPTSKQLNETVVNVKAESKPISPANKTEKSNGRKPPPLIQLSKRAKADSANSSSDTLMDANHDLSSDSDLDDLMDPNDLNSNINSTHSAKQNKFIKLIKTKSSFSSTSPTQAASESCSASASQNSASSQSSKQQQQQVKRKIFSSKRNNADSQPSFTINFNSNSLFVNENSDFAANHYDESSSSSESHEDKLKSNPNVPADKNKNSDATSLVINLRNTRKAYECEELGETQAFFDDLFYFMDGLSSKYKLSERCLCAIKLAEQCLSSEFRMSLRSSSDYLNKIFKLLNDSNKYKSLALCTSLIMFALTQDKLVIDIDKSTFYLIVNILNMSLTNPSSSNSNGSDLLSSTTSSIHSSRASSTSTSPTLASKSQNLELDLDLEENDDVVYKKIYDRCKKLFKNLNVNNKLSKNNGTNNSSSSQVRNDEGDEFSKLNDDANGNDVFESLNEDDIAINDNLDDLDLTITSNNSSNKVAALSKRSTNSNNSYSESSMFFNSQLLALECILNLNLNKQHESSSDLYKNELRELGVLDKLLFILKSILTKYKSNNGSYFYLINKYARYLGLIVAVTHQSPQNHKQQQQQQQSNSSPTKHSSQQYDSSSTTQPLSQSSTSSNVSSSAPSNLNVSVLNQNYFMDFKETFLVDLFKESLNLFYDELDKTNTNNSNAKPKRSPNLKSATATSPTNCSSGLVKMKKSIFTNSIKETFMVMINLTQNNEHASEKFATDESLVDLIFKCISSISHMFNENEQFDILIMSLGVLTNIFATNFKKESSKYLIKHIKHSNSSTFEIIFNLYKTKESQVTLAENDQENELNELNSQLETQTIETINSTFMNSINKAGRHMEDHIIAAHCALIIGYMILTDQMFSKAAGNKKNKTVNVDKAKNEMKDRSFKFMSQIIRKFLVFMKLMKVSGPSDDVHIQMILKNLDEL